MITHSALSTLWLAIGGDPRTIARVATVIAGRGIELKSLRTVLLPGEQAGIVVRVATAFDAAERLALQLFRLVDVLEVQVLEEIPQRPLLHVVRYDVRVRGHNAGVHAEAVAVVSAGSGHSLGAGEGPNAVEAFVGAVRQALVRAGGPSTDLRAGVVEAGDLAIAWAIAEGSAPCWFLSHSPMEALAAAVDKAVAPRMLGFRSA